MKTKVFTALACGLLAFSFVKVNGLTEPKNNLGISFEASESKIFSFSFVDDPGQLGCDDYHPIEDGPGVGIIRRRVCIVPGGENCSVQYVHVENKVGIGGTCPFE